MTEPAFDPAAVPGIRERTRKRGAPTKASELFSFLKRASPHSWRTRQLAEHFGWSVGSTRRALKRLHEAKMISHTVYVFDRTDLWWVA